MMFPSVVSDHATFVVHVYLLAGDVLATWAVGAGIIWQSDALTVRHKMALKLVFWGVVIETLCSLALFTFDEGISHAQQSTIEVQQSKIARLEAGVANRRLTPDQIAKFTAALSTEKGDIPLIVVNRTPDKEPHDFSEDFVDAIRAAGIAVRVDEYNRNPSSRPEYGLVVHDTPTGVLERALTAAGIRPFTLETKTSQTPMLRIVEKPLPF